MFSPLFALRVLPRLNEKDLEELPDNVKRDLTIIPVTTVDEVLEKALVNPLVPILKEIDEDEEKKEKPLPAAKPDAEEEPLTTH